MELRQYQSKAITEIEEAWNSGIKSLCYTLPTGGGKSIILRNIIDRHNVGRNKIYIIAHRKNLVNQMSGHLKKIELDHGIIMSKNVMNNNIIQVCSMQTLISRIDKIAYPDIIIIDEFHHCKSKSYLSILNKWSNAKILGVTATPRRTDGKGLADVCQRLIHGPSVSELIFDGFLSDYKYYAPDTVSMDGVHVRCGKYVEKEVMGKVAKHSITGSAIDHYRKYSNYLPAIAACVNIEHTEIVAKEFCDAGYKAKAIHSKMDEKEIYIAIKGLSDGSINILCNADLIGEGTDIPNATTLIGLRPTVSETVFLQHIGRVLRPHKDKDFAIILDHVGNFERHGMPDDERNWTLESIKINKGESKYKRCTGCLRPILKSVNKCKYCGCEFKNTFLIKKDMIPETKEGELVEIKGQQIAYKSGKQNVIRAVARLAKCQKDAIEIAKNLGYNPKFGWYIWNNILKNKSVNNN